MILLTQVAGHSKILKDNDGHVLKPLQEPPRGQNEVRFYKDIYSSIDPEDVLLRKHIPKFYGVKQLDFIDCLKSEETFLVLEDVTDGMTLPNVMDIKIGKRTWAPDATREKQVVEDSKYPGTKKTFGFSVLGIIQHSIKENSFDSIPTKYDKYFGKHLNTEDVFQIPEIFFDIRRSGVIRPLVQRTVNELKTLLGAFKKLKKYKLYASSLLLAYDVDKVRAFLESGNKSILDGAIQMKVIDFAHVVSCDKGQTDDNFIAGLESVVKVLELPLS